MDSASMDIRSDHLGSRPMGSVLEEVQMNPNASSFVYFAFNRALGLVKIGFTKNLNARITSLNSQCGVVLDVFRIIPGGSDTEQWLHERFSDLRVEGEWFYHSDKMRWVEPPQENGLRASARKFGGEIFDNSIFDAFMCRLRTQWSGPTAMHRDLTSVGIKVGLSTCKNWWSLKHTPDMRIGCAIISEFFPDWAEWHERRCKK